VLAVGLVLLILSIALTARGVSGMDIYGYLGSLAVYGFITVYFVVAAALPIYLRRRAQLTPAALTLSIAAAVAMLLAVAGTLYPIPASPYNVLPYVYLVYLSLGLTLPLLTRIGQETR
jgi:amino acid transporter